MSDPLKPSPALLVKLGSIMVHAEESTGRRGHPADAYALRSLLDDTEVKEWRRQMDELGLLPVMRDG